VPYLYIMNIVNCTIMLRWLFFFMITRQR